MSGRYRADAKALLKLIDAESAPLRRRAEERLAARLKDEQIPAAPRKKKKKGAAVGSDGASEQPPEEPKDDRSEAAKVGEATAVEAAEASGPATSKCPSCSTSNDADAVFCKRCGVSLAKPVGAES